MTDRALVLRGISDAEDKIFLAHICDLCDKSDKTGMIMYTAFMTPRQARIVGERLSHLYDIRFFGGFADAERLMAAIVPNDWEDVNYPMCAVKVDNLSKKELTHRDYLGSILALGITRDNLGDIAVTEKGAYVLSCSDIADYIVTNLTKIGSCGVRLSVAEDVSALEITKNFKTISATVTSMRLDCIVSAMTGKSRSVASELISDGLVSVNYDDIKSVSHTVKDKDVLSVRGYGKARVETDMTLTKKGRTHINIQKYI